jgi:hypothetical protein
MLMTFARYGTWSVSFNVIRHQLFRTKLDVQKCHSWGNEMLGI